MKYVIEKGIPVAPRSGEFPFNEMQVGDSILVPWPEAKRARKRAMTRNQRTKTRWVTRTVKETKTSLGGIRIWRTQ